MEFKNNMNKEKRNLLDRRKFFGKVSMGAVGVFLLSSFPFKLFAKWKKRNIKKVYVKIHPNSVKRNK